MGMSVLDFLVGEVHAYRFTTLPLLADRDALLAALALWLIDGVGSMVGLTTPRRFAMLLLCGRKLRINRCEGDS